MSHRIELRKLTSRPIPGLESFIYCQLYVFVLVLIEALHNLEQAKMRFRL
jgi:hypothetical protein